MKPYTVEYTPSAWRHIGSLSWDEFSCLQRALNRIAEVATAAFPAAPPDDEVLDAQIAGLTFRYTVDAGARVVHLVGLARQLRRAARARTGSQGERAAAPHVPHPRPLPEGEGAAALPRGN